MVVLNSASLLHSRRRASGRYEKKVYVLPKHLDEKVRRIPFCSHLNPRTPQLPTLTAILTASRNSVILFCPTLGPF